MDTGEIPTSGTAICTQHGRLIAAVAGLLLTLGCTMPAPSRAQTAPIAAMGVVSDNQSDGTADTLAPNSFYVLNRGAPNQEERAIVEFAIDNISSNIWIFQAAGLGGTGAAWPNQLWGYRANGAVTLSNYAIDDAPSIAAFGVVIDNNSDGAPDTVQANSFFVLNRGAPNQEERGVIEFDIRGKAGDSWLFVAHAGGGTGPVWPNQLWGYVADGAVTLSDFAPAGAQLLDTVNAGPNDTWVADVSNFVNQRLSNGDGYVGFMVRRANLGGGRDFWNPVMDSDFDQLLDTVVAGPNDSWSVDVSAYVNQSRAAGAAYVGFLVRRSTLGAGRNFYGPSLVFDPPVFMDGFE